MAAQICDTEQEAVTCVSAKIKNLKRVPDNHNVSRGHTVAKHTGTYKLDTLPGTAGARMLHCAGARRHIPVHKQEFCTLLSLFLHLVPTGISAGTPGPATSNAFQVVWVPDGENQRKARGKDHSALQFFLS